MSKHYNIVQNTLQTLTNKNFDIVEINSSNNLTTITFFIDEINCFQFLISTHQNNTDISLYTIKQVKNDFIDDENNTNNIVNNLLNNL